MPLHDLDLYRRDISVQSHPSVRLSVIDTGVPAAVEAPVLFFVHGYGGYGLQWRPQLEVFGGTHRVLAVDLRGHGLSDRPRSNYSVDELVGDLEGVVDQAGLPPKFTLLGHSFGGALAATYAARHPDRVERLVLIGTSVDFFSLQWGARIALTLPAVLLEPLRRLVPRRLAVPSYVLRAMYRNALRRWDGNEVLPRVQPPTLVILGERDRVYRRVAYDSVPDRVPGAQVIKVSVSAHLVHLERPAAVNRAIARFIPAARPVDAAGVAADDLQTRRPWLRRYEAGVPHALSYPAAPLHQLLRVAARRFPRRAALVSARGTLSYRRLDQMTDLLANALIRLGVSAGDRVGLLLRNSPELVVAYYGALKAGAVAVSLNPTLDGDEIAGQIGDVGARVMILDPDLPTTCGGSVLPSTVTHVILTGARGARGKRPGGGWAGARARLAGARIVGLGHLLRTAWRTPPRVPVGPDDIAVIEYSSGTSGAPKGIMLAHRNLVANVVQVRHWLADLEDAREVVLCALSLWHSYGMTACMNLGISIAATLVLPRSSSVPDLLHAITRHRPTIFPGVPEMFLEISRYPNVRRFGLRSIRACVSGAAPLPLEVLEVFERLTRARLVEGYGLTEASPITHVNPLYGMRKVGTIGVPLPDTEARIVDPRSGEALPPEVTGELVLRGPQVMVGYWNQPALTASALRDGWLFTGDMARMDADGFFHLRGRRKDMIRVEANDVFPRDVEDVLYQHPSVQEAAVTAGTIEGAVGVEAHVVLKRGTKATGEELIAFCLRQLPAHAVPRCVQLREALPKTFVGEVMKARLSPREQSRQE